MGFTFEAVSGIVETMLATFVSHCKAWGCCSYEVNYNVRSNPSAPSVHLHQKAGASQARAWNQRQVEGPYQLIWIKKTEEGSQGFLNPDSTFSTRLPSPSQRRAIAWSPAWWPTGCQGPGRTRPQQPGKKAAEAQRPATSEHWLEVDNSPPDGRSRLLRHFQRLQKRIPRTLKLTRRSSRVRERREHAREVTAPPPPNGPRPARGRGRASALAQGDT